MAPTLHPPCDGGLALDAPFRPSPPEWQGSAVCRGSDPALFHGTPTAHRRAQLVCRRCPVAAICLWSAMVAEAPTPYRYGVWGGLAAADRHRLDDELAHPAVGEYLDRLAGAVEAWQSVGAAEGATDAA